MRDTILDYKKTKYQYFSDNFKVFPVRPQLIYTVPVKKDPKQDESLLEFYDRNYPEVVITNLEFKLMVEQVAKALVAYGIKKGDIVTICHTNTPEVMYMDYALSKIGAIPNYIYPNVTPEEMKLYMTELNSKYMFILDDYPIRKSVKEATKDMNINIISSSPIEAFPYHFQIAGALTMGQPPMVELKNETKWSDFLKGSFILNNVPTAKYQKDRIASYVHTSGTSGIPKAVNLTNENDNQVVTNYATDGVIFEEGKTAIQTIPQFVEFGKVTNHLLFCNNTCVIMLPEMNPKNYYDLLHIYRPNYSFATPAHLKELIKRDTDMSNAENYLFGGDGFDFIENDANEYFKRNGAKSFAFQGYGATEFSAATIYTGPHAHKLGSVGKLSGKENSFVLVKPGTIEEITAPNIEGELCLTGSGITKGYAGNSEKENANVYRKHADGKVYLHTGDKISYDEDGFFYFHGRLKNIIKKAAFAFGTEEIVNAVMKSKHVSNCVVVPKFDKEFGEVPSCHFVLKKTDDSTDYDDIMDSVVGHVNENVQEFHRPSTYKIRNNFPLTRNNKIDFNALKIEDTASMFDGVINADIYPINDGEYDYGLNVLVEEKVLEINNDKDYEKNLNDYIIKISNIIKFKVGKIKYNIKPISFKYEDTEKMLNKNKVHVKHI